MAEAQLQTEWAAQFGRGLWRYTRSSFAFAGQNSFTDPPSQNEDQFEQLINVMPPIQGDIDRRWGYKLWNSPAGTPITASPHAYPASLWTADPPAQRYVVVGSETAAGARQLVLTESGTTTLATIPYNNGVPPRSATSRGILYSYDGVSPQKWESQFGNATENIGIDVSKAFNVAAPTTFGPKFPTTASQLNPGTIPWNNVANITALDGAKANVVLNTDDGFTNSGYMYASGFSFSIPANQALTGIVVTLNAGMVSVIAADIRVWINTGGTSLMGTSKTATPTNVGFPAITLGSALDTWDVPDISSIGLNTGQFSVVIAAEILGPVGTGVATFTVDSVQVTAYTRLLGPIIGSPNSGLVTLVSGRIYTLAYYNKQTNTFSDLAPFSLSTGPITNGLINLNSLPVHPDPQVTNKKVLSTADGQDTSTLYEVGDILNSVTTFADNIPEAILLLNNQWQASLSDGSDVGLADNAPPPGGAMFPTLHRGRMYVLVGSDLFFSKNDAELLTPTGIVAGNFEEAWPGLNFFPVTNSGEIARGLLSDGTVLYVGTDSRIIRLFGDGPDTFLQPHMLFDNVGILNQDVWQLIFIQGNPVGAMWLTPDNRVVGSDFNTYQDIGTPIQNILDNINSAALNSAWASYVGISIFNLYVLAVPTGSNTQPDTLLVFDLKGKQWFQWTTTDKLVGGFWWVAVGGKPQFIVQAASGKLYVFDPTSFQDRVGDTPVNFPALIRTSWLSLGDPTARKFLNEIEIMTGDPSMTLTVEGASTVAEFASPSQVIINKPIIQKPLGEFAVFLAGASTKDRFYRFTFNSSDQATDLLRTYSIQGKILHRV